MCKKLTAMLLGSFMIISLCACGKTETPSEKPSTPVATESEIVSETETEAAPAETETAETETSAETEKESEIEAAPAEGETPAQTESESTSTDENQAAVETPAASEEPAETENSDDMYVGNWYEKIAQRGYMTITEENGVYTVQVNWSGSADTNYVWDFTGTLNEAGILCYNDCKQVLYTWLSEDETTEEVLKENASGEIYILENGNMIWTEYDEPEPNEFVKEMDIE